MSAVRAREGCVFRANGKGDWHKTSRRVFGLFQTFSNSRFTVLAGYLGLPTINRQDFNLWVKLTLLNGLWDDEYTTGQRGLDYEMSIVLTQTKSYIASHGYPDIHPTFDGNNLAMSNCTLLEIFRCSLKYVQSLAQLQGLCLLMQGYKDHGIRRH